MRLFSFEPKFSTEHNKFEFDKPQSVMQIESYYICKIDYHLSQTETYLIYVI